MCRSGWEFDTSHPARDHNVNRLRLPFRTFPEDTRLVPREGGLMRRSPRSARIPGRPRGRFGAGPVHAVRRATAALFAAVLLSGGVAACGKDGPGDTLDALLSGWKTGDFAGVGFVTPDGGSVPAAKVADEIIA